MGFGADPASCDEDCQQALQERLNAFIEQSKAALTEEMNALGEQKGQELRDWADERAKELENEQVQRFEQMQQAFENVDGNIQAVAAERQAFYYESYNDRFLEKKRDVIRKAMEPQYEAAIARIKEHENELNLGKQEGKDVSSSEELIRQFQDGWDDLIITISEAENSEDIDEAIDGFKSLWLQKQSQLELARTKGSAEVIERTLQKLEEHDTEKKLSEQRAKVTESIDKLERLRSTSGKLSQEGIEKLRLLKTILPLIDETMGIINQFKKATPSDDLLGLLELKDRLQDKLAQIERVARMLGFVNIPGDGIFIEAENESFTELLPHRLQ